MAEAKQDLIDLLRQDPRRALDEANQIVKTSPGHAIARLVLAEVIRRDGDPNKALVHAKEGRRAAPDNTLLALEEARCLAALGEKGKAAKVLESSLANHPDFVPGWRALGQLCEQLGDLEGAKRAQSQQASLGLSQPDLAKASELLHRGKLGQAEFLLRQFVKQDPTNVSAIRLLADIGNRLGMFEDARKLLQRCLELAPDFHIARHDYANVLIKLQEFDSAEKELRTVIAAEPEAFMHKVLEGFLYVRTARYEDAIDVYERIVAEQPHLSRVQMSLGHALKTIGRQEDSIAAYRDATAVEPTLGEAWWSLANLKTFEFSDDDIAQIQTQLESEAINHSDRYHLQFALGKALEDHKQFDQAFQAYETGNKIRRSGIKYSADRLSEERQAQESVLDEAFFQKREGWGATSNEPIFIIGLPRSGSTLLEQILASHSQVEGTFELPDIISMARRLSGRKRADDESAYPAILETLSANDVKALGEEYLDRTRVHRTGKPRFIDKMPNNFQHTGFIRLILPNAKIVDARRHPMACGFSNFKQLFARGQNFSYSLEEIGRYYLDYKAWMDHWERVVPGYVHRVIYEQMVANSEQEVRALLDFCDLEFEQACLSFHKTDRAVRTASSEQVRQPIYQSSLEQWRPFERQLSPLSELMKPIMDVNERWAS